tara:strand:- start:285 stop:569 length:285 start_codon:yes stop_codon:yes gene_type:complete
MAVPKQRHTKSRRDKRRMHLYIKEVVSGICSKCGKTIKPHTVCQSCGYYKGREMIDVLAKLTKKERKKKEKEMATQESEQKKDQSLSMEGLSKK